MPQQQPETFVLLSKPGVKRDGTDLDSEYYTDAQWVRWVQGRARKMGGYRAISDLLTGPIRAVRVDARTTTNTAHTFNPFGIQQLSFDNNGVGAGIVDRTPAGFATNLNYSWQSDVMYSGAGGGIPALICVPTPDLDNIANDTTGIVYSGDVAGTGALAPVQDGSGNITVSGGCVVLQPMLVVYGSNGLIRNSNPNDFSVATGWSGGAGLANTANVAGTKIVKGLPLRGGSNSPSGLFWALDSLIRMSFVGGSTIWKFDTVSARISVLSKSAIVEYDGLYFWPGLDRFFVFNGVVQELPNNLNQDWFFDNLNFEQRAKVWGMAIPRFGEIWWFFPSGTNTECDTVCIYNIKEQTWYDTLCTRTAGVTAQLFRYPLMTGGISQPTLLLTYTAGAGTFVIGNIVTGGTSGATGTVVRVMSGGILNLTGAVGTFVNGETISSGGATGTLTAVPVSQTLDAIWNHEIGTDAVHRQQVSAIETWVETSNFQWMTGGPVNSGPMGTDTQTRLVRMEPDFVCSGQMTVQAFGRSYAQSPKAGGDVHVFDANTEYIPMRDQRREMSLRFGSNTIGGTFKMGRNICTIQDGDRRG